MIALLGASVTSFSNATAAWGKETMKVSSTGPSNTLPSFYFMAKAEEGGDIYSSYNFTGGRGTPKPYEPATSCPEDVFENTSPDLRVPKLPWRVQESWGCESGGPFGSNKTSDVDVMVLENDHLRAAITTQWGGKVWSLYNKKDKKQLFFNNPAHQPANIGYLKAWASGGAEWNWAPGYIGHSVFTESPVWTAVLPSRLGPVVRVWEYDRLNSTVWQVDILLVGDAMFVHPKVTNPNFDPLPGYWWTCVAMTIDDPKTRVVTPAAITENNDDGACSAWPKGGLEGFNDSFVGADIRGCASTGTCAWQQDMSFLGNIPHSNDFFFHIDEDTTPWIAHVRGSGYTVIHSHPKNLNGTKFFQWGYNEFGTWNQDFLSASQTVGVPGCNNEAYDPWCKEMKHEGPYTELQVGPARTQMHTFPVPPATKASTPAASKAKKAKDAKAAGVSRGVFEWTEWFKGFQADVKTMQAADYQVPIKAVNTWLKSPTGMSDATIKEVDDMLKAMADTPPTPEQIVYKGMPHGGLQEKLLAKVANGGVALPLAPGCPFPSPDVTDETRPWLELLENGTFSAGTLKRVPANFEVSTPWVSLLDKSEPKTWLHHLFLGTHALEVGNAVGGKLHMSKSMELKPNVHAQRALALLAPTAEAAEAAYNMAWALWAKLSSDATAWDADDPNIQLLGSDLAVELSGWLLLNGRYTELLSFVTSLEKGGKATQAFLKTDRLLHVKAALAVHAKDYKTAITTLTSNCFPTYGSERSALLALWWEAQKLKEVEEANGGQPLSNKQKLQLRKRIRCDGDRTANKIDDPCVNGPPNIGYAY